MTWPTSRRGFTLIELLISLIVSAIVGGALVRMVLSQARFMDQQEAYRGARSTARGGLNRLLSDLRAVEATGGLEAAAAGGQDFTIRVPYAWGIMCSNTTGVLTTLSLLPVDSAMFAAPGFSGFAWRNSATGAYTYQTAAVSLTTPGTPGNCTAAVPTPITTLPAINGSPAGQTVNVGGAVPLAALGGPPVGSIFFLFRRVRYQFKASTALPGRTGLFRTMMSGGASEEIATPFATTARVNFYVLNATPAQSAVPGTLGNTRGLELVLDGMSERTPGGSATPKTASVTTSVFFENRPD
jgi:prepilin-type N-terminal cleavage/methylation domain-containing protein